MSTENGNKRFYFKVKNSKKNNQENLQHQMDRINSVGIRQRRFEITKYKYYPKPKSEYEQKLDDVLNNR